MLTLRKKIAEALEQECLDLQEISKLFGIKEREVLDHLEHMPSRPILNALPWNPPPVNNVGFLSRKELG
jgi:predicted Zn-ribbon and HTH transcriptional regulator